MFRFLLILGIVVYLIYKVGSLFFKAGAGYEHLRNQQQRKPVEPRGNPRPSDPQKKGKNKAGEYIDYEEIK